MNIRANRQIRSPELRIIGAAGENLGVLSLTEALAKAAEAGLDLIEISPNATPPVAKIADYGKFQYEQNKKQREIRAKSKDTEIKTLQIKIGTGEHDLALKAKRASEWLSENHRVKVDLFLPGRSKYLDQKFHHERIERFLKLITIPYRLAETPKKSLKGMSLVVEKE